VRVLSILQLELIAKGLLSQLFGGSEAMTLCAARPLGVRRSYARGHFVGTAEAVGTVMFVGFWRLGSGGSVEGNWFALGQDSVRIRFSHLASGSVRLSMLYP
jgi:hypothetical protein